MYRWAVVLVLGCAGEQPNGPSAPEAHPELEVRISPEAPTTDSPLVAEVQASAEGQQPSLSWSVEGSEQSTEAILDPSLTGKHQIWTLRAELDGAVATADTTILNSPPPSPVVQVEPTAPAAGLDALSCLSSWDEDADGDPVKLQRIQWWVDGEPAGGEASVPADELSAGQQWSCEVLVSDGEAQSTGMSDPVEVLAFDLSTADPWIEPEVQLDPLDARPGEGVRVHYRGELAAAEEVVLKLGFDGWTAISWDREPVQGATEEEDPLFWWKNAMAPDGEGGWFVDLELPAAAHALHMSFEAPDGAGGRLIDDRDGLEHHWGLDFPYLGPYLSYNDATDPRSGVVISFESSVPCLGVVEWGPEGGPRRHQIGSELDTVHHIELHGLEAGQRYTYRVMDSTGRISPEFSFSTLPQAASALSLLAMADMQDGGTAEDRWPEVAATAWETVPDAQALFIPGDLAANDYPGHWWRYFEGGGELFASVPQLPMLGNHDTPGLASSADSTSFRRYFSLPEAAGSEDWYRVDLGPLRLLALSTEQPEQLEPGSAQWEWLDGELAEVEPPPWTVVGCHHPPYDVGLRFAAEVEDYRGITELFDGRVDWVFTAHEHLYQRTLPVQFEGVLATSGLYGPGPEDGTGYLVLPTAGDVIFSDTVLPDGPLAEAWELTAFPDPPAGNPAVVLEEHGFVELGIDGRSILLRSWGMGTSTDPVAAWVRDEIEYTKP